MPVQLLSMTKKDGINYVRERLKVDPKWQIKGLLRLYSYQDTMEQECEQTQFTNGRGFTMVDARILSSFAKQYQEKGWLSRKQYVILAKRIPHYAKQLYAAAIDRLKTEPQIQPDLLEEPQEIIEGRV